MGVTLQNGDELLEEGPEEKVGLIMSAKCGM